MNPSDPKSLVLRLVRFLETGQVDARILLPAIREMVGDDFADDSAADLIDALKTHGSPAAAVLVDHLKEARRQKANLLREQRLSGKTPSDTERLLLGDLPLEAPLGWQTSWEISTSLAMAVALTDDCTFLNRSAVETSQIQQLIAERLERASAEARKSLNCHASALIPDLIEITAAAKPLPEAARVDLKSRLEELLARQRTVVQQALNSPERKIPDGLNESIVLEELGMAAEEADSPESRQSIVDLILSRPSAQSIELIEQCCQTPEQRERAELILTLRFGKQTSTGWLSWQVWFGRQKHNWDEARRNFFSKAKAHSAEVLMIWYAGQEDPNPTTIGALEECCQSVPELTTFINRWSDELSREEWNALDPESTAPLKTTDLLQQLRILEPENPLVRPPPLPASTPSAAPIADASPKPVEPKPAPIPRKPSFWQTHVQPLISENWYVIAGIAMVIVGASLLAYYTWDKVWWIRYSVMPALLGGFTWSIGRLAGWIDRKGDEFQSMSTMLRGAAIGLLPLNFMVVALLANDPNVPGKTLVAPLLAVVYLIAFGRETLSWCGKVAPELRSLLGFPLLALNGLIMLVPLVGMIIGPGTGNRGTLIGVSFYAGFAVVAWGVMTFSRHVLTRAMAEEKRLPWFFGATLAITFLQAFAWVHGLVQQTPPPHFYAVMVILMGGLVLFVERRNLELFESTASHRAESFLGFAFIFLGILMGAEYPHTRVISFLLGGAVWMYQAAARRHVLHHWIGLTLIVLGGAAIGLLNDFPRQLLGGLGIGMGVALGITRLMMRGRGKNDLADVCAGMQMIVLLLTSVVTVLAQWHFHSQPLLSASFLIFIAGHFIWSGLKEERLGWIHGAMMVLAVALPYLGCVDLEQRTLHGNTMVFGLAILSFLWLAMIGVIDRPLLRQARSTVLWLYGAFAVTGMLVRVVLEQNTPVNPLWYLNFMDYTGPLLMTVALTIATYYSRSLIPALMAVFIVVILFPELRANLRDTFVDHLWGTGLGSATSSLGLLIGCFGLRRWKRLQNMPEGDRFFGRHAFPLQRPDHTVFTWPMLAALVFLALKVDTWNLIRNLSETGVPLKTALAVCVTAATWTLLGVYFAQDKKAPAGTIAGALVLWGGIVLFNWSQTTPWHWSGTLLTTGLAWQIAWFAWRLLPASKLEWVARVLLEPMQQCLRIGSLFTVLAVITSIFFSAEVTTFLWLGAFLIVQMVWHGLDRKLPVFGAGLYFLLLVMTLAAAHPGGEILLTRLHANSALATVLSLNLCAMLLSLVQLRQRAGEPPPLGMTPRSILSPLLVCATIGTLAIGMGLVANTAVFNWISMEGLWGLTLGALLVAGTLNRSMPFLMLAMLLAYGWFLSPLLNEAGSLIGRMEIMMTPWRLATFALSIVAVYQAGRILLAPVGSRLFAGRAGHPFFETPQSGWIEWPAVVFACLATAYQSVDPIMRNESVQTLAPFLGALTLGLVGWFRRKGEFHCGAVGLLFIGNLHLVRVFLGDALRAAGLSDLHIICLGIGVSLVQISLARRYVRAENGGALLNQSGLVLAGMVLLLLSANYFTHPNLESITPWRFIFSGALSLLTGMYFRRAVLTPAAGEGEHAANARAMYHYGIVMAIWCAVLVLPFMRLPAITLIALAMPVFYFYLRAELGLREGSPEALGYRNSAAAIGFLILALYTFRSAFQMMFFPEELIELAHYHYNSPLLIVLSLVLLRLHGLGGTSWLAFYGGLALTVGSYFLLTWIPALDPFQHTVPSAWAAIGLGHFWILMSVTRSPLRTFIQRMAALDDPSWHSVRRSWGVALAVAAHAAVTPALVSFHLHPLMVAPLLLGLATMLLSQGIVRKSPTFLALAGVELLATLHTGFFIESYLPKEQVVWVVLMAWFGVLALREMKSEWLPIRAVGSFATGAGALVFFHVLYHGASSTEGLWAFGLGALLAALTPREGREASGLENRFFAAALFVAPTWLMFFSQWETDGDATRPLLLGAMTALATGGFARWFQAGLAPAWHEWERTDARLFDQTLNWFEVSGGRICVVANGFALLVGGGVQALHYGSAFTPFELGTLLILHAGVIAAWFDLNRRSDSMLPPYLMQLGGLALFAAIRRHLMLTSGFWNYEYDVWAAVAVSYCIAGLKQSLDRQPRRTRLPFVTTLVVLPAVACVWVLVHHLGTDAALLVVGLYSLMFGFLGKDERESPYNAVAIFGFVAFVVISFWSKLGIHHIHAYVLPVGLGILVLLQLFGRQLEAETRNRIRFVTLLAMIGSAGYYALVDKELEVIYNVILIGLCLGSMLLGSFLRIRLYLSVGFVGLLIDLVSIVFKVMLHLERGPRMTTIGSLVLLVGTSLVFGAIYYKTHREVLTMRLNTLRQRFGDWE